MTLNCMMNAPEIFRAGIAGAPVTNWRNYDTIYTSATSACHPKTRTATATARPSTGCPTSRAAC